MKSITLNLDKSVPYHLTTYMKTNIGIGVGIGMVRLLYAQRLDNLTENGIFLLTFSTFLDRSFGPY
jgi:hypothetical protein